jgi:SAM-dependent methyltransferase
MRPLIKVALPLAAVSAAALLLHRRAGSLGQPAAGGVLIGDAAAYDRLTGWLLGSFYDGIAADIAATASPGASVLDVGCGPGHLTRRLAALGFDVTGIDLDPAMIERATARGGGRYLAADAASLPFDARVFDLAVSTLSMHHWADVRAGLAEIGRVVRPEGPVLVWDLRRGAPLHRHAPDPLDALHGGPLELVATRRWRWPGPLSFVQRIELRAKVASTSR